MEKRFPVSRSTPPQDLLEATNALLIMYHHVPSITSFPVYLGNLDELLEPFVLKETPQRAKQILKMFLLHIDRTLTDSFVHADLRPQASRTGELLLELTEEMQCAMPNLTLKYDPQTSDDFSETLRAVHAENRQPSFANHAMFTREWGENYAIASCYNGLKIGGGGFTLPRIRLYECSLKAKDPQDFLDNVLPRYVQIMLEMMEDRIRFIVETSAFFKANFLVTEGFVKLENFTGMFGMVGLAECVNHLLGDRRSAARLWQQRSGG